MPKKHQTQAIPEDGRKGAPDGTNQPGRTGRSGGGESGGGPYPNPHTGKDSSEAEEGLDPHGGQTVLGYHGPQELGDQKVKPDGNPNAGSRSD